MLEKAAKEIWNKPWVSQNVLSYDAARFVLAHLEPADRLWLRVQIQMMMAALTTMV